MPTLGMAENVVYVCGVPSLPTTLLLDRTTLEPGCRVTARPGPSVDPNASAEFGSSSSSSASASASSASAAAAADPRLVAASGLVLPPEAKRGQRVGIVHPERRAPLPDGVVGEVWISGLCAALGYYNQHELSSQTFGATMVGGPPPSLSSNGKSANDGARHPPGRLPPPHERFHADSVTASTYTRSGDLGFIHEQQLYIVGRIKDVLTIRGRTMHAHDLEASAEKGCELLRPGCSVAFASDDGGSEELVLLVELREARHAEAALSAAARQICAAVATEHGASPREVLMLKPKTVLKTTSGKVRRRACAAAYVELLASRRAAAEDLAGPPEWTQWSQRPQRTQRTQRPQWTQRPQRPQRRRAKRPRPERPQQQSGHSKQNGEKQNGGAVDSSKMANSISWKKSILYEHLVPREAAVARLRQRRRLSSTSCAGGRGTDCASGGRERLGGCDTSAFSERHHRRESAGADPGRRRRGRAADGGGARLAGDGGGGE